MKNLNFVCIDNGRKIGKMQFMISADSDVGIKKTTNQDSLLIKEYETHIGNVVLAVLCDGMGGFDKGEVASATVIKAFEQWGNKELAFASEHPQYEHILRQQWFSLASELNEKIMNYGRMHGIKLGTTVVAMLFTQNRYFLMNIGDSRAYEIRENQVIQLTKDQTLVAREVELGHITEKQAETDSRKSVLLQCVGASEQVYPDMFYGEVKQNTTYMLCSDGFRHVITQEEIYRMLAPEILTDSSTSKANIRYLINLNIHRNEQDNITSAIVRTY